MATVQNLFLIKSSRNPIENIEFLFKKDLIKKNF